MPSKYFFRDDSLYCLELLETLAQTNRFSVCTNAFLTSEKKLIKEVIDILRKNTNEEKRAQELLEKYNCRTL